MNYNAALYQFYSSFGLPAYPSGTVPEDATFPYITYESATAEFGDGPATIAVKVWYYTESEKVPNDKAMEISNRIGRGGIMIPCDGGAVWITKGSPFCLNLTGEDRLLKQRHLNLNLEYIL